MPKQIRKKPKKPSWQRNLSTSHTINLACLLAIAQGMFIRNEYYVCRFCLCRVVVFVQRSETRPIFFFSPLSACLRLFGRSCALLVSCRAALCSLLCCCSSSARMSSSVVDHSGRAERQCHDTRSSSAHREREGRRPDGTDDRDTPLPLPLTLPTHVHKHTKGEAETHRQMEGSEE